MTEAEWTRLSQLFDDVLPYYTRIAVGIPDKEFIRQNHDACVRMALAGKQTVLACADIKPEDAIFSDPQFAQCIEYAWKNIFSDEDKHFLNDNLKKAAECFRVGFMLADLPENS
ncbi:MAG: hypothetical protein J6X31_07160 [Bacteroidales bacterium]|nr:hypothetical protein [Bacteroidales bacterium]